MHPTFKFSGKVWIYPGVGGWHFVSLPGTVSERIRKCIVEQKPWGYVKVRATIGKTSWQTGLWPQKQDGVYLLVIKAEVRRREDIRVSNTVRGTIVLLS